MPPRAEFKISQTPFFSRPLSTQILEFGWLIQQLRLDDGDPLDIFCKIEQFLAQDLSFRLII